MKKINIEIAKGQRLGDIINEIPTNTILFKTLTGIGATHLELNTPRHSIIIEPNVPVIKGKKAKGIFGIYEGIHAMDIVAHLVNKSFEYKKIMVTPESFHKVKTAMEYVDIDMYSDFFLLFDECDRTAKDVDFREKIIFPMDDFFRFRNRAFVSATAMTPSDPRFKDHGFSIMEVAPTYDYSEDLRLVSTNIPSLAFKQEVINGHHGSDAVFCIFFNSVKGIASLIEELEIKEQSTVFCSRDRLGDLPKGIFHKGESLDTDKFNKYNFFTSRFYAAVDIFLDFKPHVIIYTDLSMAEHSMIDPHSDAIQIVGRFREGVSSITAISNHDPELNFKTCEEAESYLQGCEESYNQIRGLYKAADKVGARETLEQALLLVPYARFVHEDGRKNHFMHDHYHYNERQKSHYIGASSLFGAYQNNPSGSRHFNAEHVALDFKITDRNKKRRGKKVPFRETVIEITAVLDRILAPSETMFSLDNRQTVLDELTKLYPDIVKGYRLLGRDKFLEIAYSAKDVKKALRMKENKNARSNFKFIHELHERFSDGMVIEQTVLLNEFRLLIEKHGLSLKAEMPEFENFFEVKGRSTDKEFGRGIATRKIIKSKYNRD